MHRTISIKQFLTTLFMTCCLFGSMAVLAQDVGRDGLPFANAPAGSGSDCLFANGTPGCDDAQCEALICASDSFCCDVAWDGLCASAAIEQCQIGGGGDDDRATFRVTKNFTDDNPAEVRVDISCNTGLPLDQSKMIAEGDTVTFVVQSFDDGQMNCSITEVVPDGYSASYSAGVSPGCTFEQINQGDAYRCEITNSPDPVDIDIEKVWVFEGSGGDDVDTSYYLTLYCENGWIENLGQAGTDSPEGVLCLLDDVSGDDDDVDTSCIVFHGDGDEQFTASVTPGYPSANCWVEESFTDSYVEVDNDCQNLEISAGQGASCTVTNTVFFEGIPTLSRYGMAIAALLMLAVGVVGFRRFS